MKKTIWIPILLIGILVVLDQWTKHAVVDAFTAMEVPQNIIVIPNFFEITLSYNTGGAWSIFEGHMVFFYFITAVAGVLFYVLLKDVNIHEKKMYGYGIILMIAGGIGNFIDRAIYQKVTDFINIDLWNYTTFPHFNIADMCLVIGMILFATDIILEELMKWKQSSSNKNSN